MSTAKKYQAIIDAKRRWNNVTLQSLVEIIDSNGQCPTAKCISPDDIRCPIYNGHCGSCESKLKKAKAILKLHVKENIL